MHVQEWGSGDPVIALHPLALESTAFAGVARGLIARGLRTLAVDLPGFGRTPAPEEPLTPATLAAPVIELARFINPRFAEKIPLEYIWPLLKRVAESIEAHEDLEHDWLARASVRVIYYSSCAATRSAFVSAARELALDPALGPEGTWTRMRGLAVPAAFLWCGRDALIPAAHAELVARKLPRARRLELACSGHFVHGRHYRCFNRAISDTVGTIVGAPESARRSVRRAPIQCVCLADANGSEAAAVARTEEA
ncbi:MAG: hypothetical protein JRH16_08985 [Deltaproteobacteria bacterium]|nr:hypothetical protein [Deltaproteobacteria bacterium]MBW2359631.1 hypothetical protein [Deltaproteobacteria bacterium]